MNIDLDLGKLMLGICTFVVTLYINRNIKQLDSLNEKLEHISVELAELRGSISGRFVLNDPGDYKPNKKA